MPQFDAIRPKKDASGSPRRASLLPARTAASSYGPASTSIQSTFCRCVLVASCGGGRSSPRFGDERQTIVVSLFALCMSGQAAAGHYHRAALLQPDFLPTVHSRQSTTTARHRVTASFFCARSRGSRAGTLWPSAARVPRAHLRTPATVPSPHTFWPA